VVQFFAEHWGLTAEDALRLSCQKGHPVMQFLAEHWGLRELEPSSGQHLQWPDLSGSSPPTRGLNFRIRCGLLMPLEEAARVQSGAMGPVQRVGSAKCARAQLLPFGRVRVCVKTKTNYFEVITALYILELKYKLICQLLQQKKSALARVGWWVWWCVVRSGGRAPA